MTPHRIGSWTCPSGNSCDVTLDEERGGVRLILCAWDSPPPLHPDDELYYRLVILPRLTKLVNQYLEKVGPTLVLLP